MTPAAFLDRDGTINVRPAPHDYVRSPEAFVWLPGALEGMVELAGKGYLLSVVSNQRGIARGSVSWQVVREIEREIQGALARRGHRVSAFAYCPHGVSEACACRKPAPGLLFRVARERDVDLSRSWMIGDADSDVEAGIAAGCRTVRIGPAGGRADLHVSSLLEAARAIPPAGSIEPLGTTPPRRAGTR